VVELAPRLRSFLLSRSRKRRVLRSTTQRGLDAFFSGFTRHASISRNHATNHHSRCISFPQVRSAKHSWSWRADSYELKTPWRLGRLGRPGGVCNQLTGAGMIYWQSGSMVCSRYDSRLVWAQCCSGSQPLAAMPLPFAHGRDIIRSSCHTQPATCALDHVVATIQAGMLCSLQNAFKCAWALQDAI
jgi:hypothetical protein